MVSQHHFLRQLIHTCTVTRPTTSQSPTGESLQSYSTVDTAVRCRLTMKLERWADEATSREKVKTHLLLALPETDIQVGDRLTSFAWFKTREEIDNVGTLEVLHALQRNTTTTHHISFELEEVS